MDRQGICGSGLASWQNLWQAQQHICVSVPSSVNCECCTPKPTAVSRNLQFTYCFMDFTSPSCWSITHSFYDTWFWITCMNYEERSEEVMKLCLTQQDCSSLRTPEGWGGPSWVLAFSNAEETRNRCSSIVSNYIFKRKLNCYSIVPI